MNYKLSTTNLACCVDNCQVMFCSHTLEPHDLRMRNPG